MALYTATYIVLIPQNYISKPVDLMFDPIHPDVWDVTENIHTIKLLYIATENQRKARRNKIKNRVPSDMKMFSYPMDAN